MTDDRTARAAAQSILRQLNRVSQLSKANPGLVRIATGLHGDSIAFWNDGSPREFNISDAQRKIEAIKTQYPDAMKSRSGNQIVINLPLVK